MYFTGLAHEQNRVAQTAKFQNSTVLNPFTYRNRHNIQF